MMVLTASGSRKAKAVPLIMGDTVEKADIEICKHPSGRGDWLLGTGASGKAGLLTSLTTNRQIVHCIGSLFECMPS